jgi:lysophospholipase L1-like esterase
MPKYPSSIDRRRFLHQSMWGLGLGMSWPAAESLAAPANRLQVARAHANERVILFQGDSITDAGRSRDDRQPNQTYGLGHGYVALAAAHVLGAQPEAGWHCYNRGISGDKVPQLAARWHADCLNLRPDVLSILVGVNDFWHTLTQGYNGTAASYEAGYRALLNRTREALPDVTLIIGEPFAVPGGSAIDSEWEAFDAYRAAAHRVAEDYDATWIPYQSLFDEALEAAPVDYWTPDGVHPSLAGNERMAQAWVDAFHAAIG